MQRGLRASAPLPSSRLIGIVAGWVLTKSHWEDVLFSGARRHPLFAAFPDLESAVASSVAHRNPLIELVLESFCHELSAPGAAAAAGRKGAKGSAPPCAAKPGAAGESLYLSSFGYANLTSLANDAYAHPVTPAAALRGAPPLVSRINNCVLLEAKLRGWPVLLLVTTEYLVHGEELLAGYGSTFWTDTFDKCVARLPKDLLSLRGGASSGGHAPLSTVVLPSAKEAASEGAPRAAGAMSGAVGATASPVGGDGDGIDGGGAAEGGATSSVHGATQTSSGARRTAAAAGAGATAVCGAPSTLAASPAPATTHELQRKGKPLCFVAFASALAAPVASSASAAALPRCRVLDLARTTKSGRTAEELLTPLLESGDWDRAPLVIVPSADAAPDALKRFRDLVGALVAAQKAGFVPDCDESAPTAAVAPGRRLYLLPPGSFAEKTLARVGATPPAGASTHTWLVGVLFAPEAAPPLARMHSVMSAGLLATLPPPVAPAVATPAVVLPSAAPAPLLPPPAAVAPGFEDDDEDDLPPPKQQPPTVAQPQTARPHGGLPSSAPARHAPASLPPAAPPQPSAPARSPPSAPMSMRPLRSSAAWPRGAARPTFSPEAALPAMQATRPPPPMPRAKSPRHRERSRTRSRSPKRHWANAPPPRPLPFPPPTWWCSSCGAECAYDHGICWTCGWLASLPPHPPMIHHRSSPEGQYEAAYASHVHARLLDARGYHAMPLRDLGRLLSSTHSTPSNDVRYNYGTLYASLYAHPGLFMLSLDAHGDCLVCCAWNR